MPRWGGSFEEVDELISRINRDLPNDLGLSPYARLYWTYADLEGDDVDLFTETKISWPDVKQGFEDLVRLHPDSDYLLNGFAYMACRADDSVTYQVLRSSLAERHSASAWSNKYSIATCDERMHARIE